MHSNELLRALINNARIAIAKENEMEEEESDLNPRQQAMYEMYENIAEKFGKWNQGNGADGAHYVAQSPFKEEGMICSNCEYFEGGNGCEIVTGEIEADAICKLWIIKEGLIKGATK